MRQPLRGFRGSNPGSGRDPARGLASLREVAVSLTPGSRPGQPRPRAGPALGIS